jgi:hypothetical protein
MRVAGREASARRWHEAGRDSGRRRAAWIGAWSRGCNKVEPGIQVLSRGQVHVGVISKNVRGK